MQAKRYKKIRKNFEILYSEANMNLTGIIDGNFLKKAIDVGFDLN